MNNAKPIIQHEVHFTYVYLFQAARWAIEQAESGKELSDYPSMHSILASVHCIEAFLNTLGPQYFGTKWDTPGYNTPKEKIRAVLSHFGLKPADIQQQYDRYMLAIQIRDELVHGRTHEISRQTAKIQREIGSVQTNTDPLWLRHCHVKPARLIYDDIIYLIEYFLEKSGQSKYRLEFFSYGDGWIKYPENK